MITEERLKELIKNNEKIYSYIHSNGITVPKIIEYNTLDLVLNLLIPLQSQLFEKKEDVEWELEFGNIAYTRKFTPPTYEEVLKEELKKYDTFYFRFRTVGGWDNEICVWTEDGEKFEVAVIDEMNSFKFKEPFNKENYIEACRLAKKLFFGDKQ